MSPGSNPNLESLLNLYWTIEQLARELDICPRTLARWHERREGPPRVKIGNKVLYKRTSVISWLANKEAQPARTIRRPHANVAQSRQEYRTPSRKVSSRRS
jgi:Helix-turn-helix domain